jgi:3-dehydroquinate dehydratase-1
LKSKVKVRNVTIGEGVPKICVSMIGRTITELVAEAEYLKTLDLDIVELRADFFNLVENIERVKEALSEIRAILNDIPLIFTFRSAREGGEKEIGATFYQDLNNAVIDTGQVDIIDVELCFEEVNVKALVERAHANKVLVIISNHDFAKTPVKDVIVSRLRKAQELGGDLPKIAVMPNNNADVLTLLDATNTMNEQYADRPIITIAMGEKGVVSRVAGGIFGSVLTFAASKKASAPGQVDIEELRTMLDLLY